MRRRLVLALVLGLSVLGIRAVGVRAEAATVPTQWIAKSYTEILGRAPLQTEWQTAVASFATCDEASLRALTRPLLVPAEASTLKQRSKTKKDPVLTMSLTDNAARLLTLFRSVLNREPDPDGFAHYKSELDAGTSWGAVVDEVFASTEFTSQVVPQACGANPAYGFGALPALDVGASGAGFTGGTGDQLQALLDATPAGGTVYLAQKAVVRIQMPLTIPAGVTLATTGRPGRRSYSQLGRLVRASFFPKEMVTVNAGGSLDNVWIDGQRGVPLRVAAGPAGTPSDQTAGSLGLRQGDTLGTGQFTGSALNQINVLLLGGTITNSYLSNTSGWTTVQMGTSDGSVCTASVTDNLITAYASRHVDMFSDGLSNYCDNATIENNEIVDTTDVAIVSFPTSSLLPQASQVRHNVVLSAGNSAYAGLGADGTVARSTPPDFTGLVYADNLVWGGSRTHFDIAITVGSRAWFGKNSSTGHGAAFFNNSSGALTLRAGTGIAVAGMLDATVTGNTLNVEIAPEAAPCPHVAVGASVSAGYASGTIQPYTDVLYEGCITNT